MKRYIVTVQVATAEGYQVYVVDADSPEAAIEAYHAGEGELTDEEINITSLEDPGIEDVEEA